MIDALTTVPASMISDTREIIEISLPVSGNATSAPVNATGRISITMTGMVNDSNCTARTKYTSPRATTSARSRLPKLSIISL